jgi:uncharacterized protein YcfJ
MKKLILTVMTSATLLSGQAQLFSPEAFNGALFGSLIGGLVGGSGNHRCGNSFSGQGAAIGAGVGLLAGALVGEARRNAYAAEQPYVYTPATTVSLGYGYETSRSSAYVYYAPNAYTAPGYYYQPSRPNYAVGGTLLGAASGALIGAGSNRAGKGAAIGAVAGLALGGVAELASRPRSQQATAVQPPAPQPAAAPTHDASLQAQDAPVRITSTPVADSTYTWTPRPQIANAARVPDAPTF